ncbi:hypothetical protein ABT324_29355 [Saccharopolyspora sp. NPDC000359]|uniref:hypothetical protein n=1 Tax=Saccharopolyspora sp. NPDC000359 TaxID=3154251 RepID=UPI00331727E9
MTTPQSFGAGLAATGNAMQGIIDSSNRGEFRVTPDAGNDLIRTFGDFQDELDAMISDMGILAQRTQLGDSPAG